MLSSEVLSTLIRCFKAVAETHCESPGQVVLMWGVRRGTVVQQQTRAAGPNRELLRGSVVML